MEGELETLLQQLLDHHLQLCGIGYTSRVGLCRHIELLRFEPGRSLRDLPRMQVIRELDQIAHRRTGRGLQAASDYEKGKTPLRSGGLDRGHFKPWFRVRSHGLRRGWRIRNGPSGFGSGARQVEGRWRTSLGPSPFDRVPIPAHPSL